MLNIQSKKLFPRLSLGGGYLQISLESHTLLVQDPAFLARFSEIVCHCLLPMSEREGLAQSYPVAFVPKMGLELSPSF